MKSVVTVIMGVIIAACLATSPTLAASCCDPTAAGPGINNAFPQATGSPSFPTRPIPVQGYGPPAVSGVSMMPRCGGCQVTAGCCQTPATPRQSCCSAPNSGRPNISQTVNPASDPIPKCCAGGALSAAAQRVETATPMTRFTSASSSPARVVSPPTHAVYGAGIQASNAGPFGKPGYFPGSSLW